MGKSANVVRVGGISLHDARTLDFYGEMSSLERALAGRRKLTNAPIELVFRRQDSAYGLLRCRLTIDWRGHSRLRNVRQRAFELFKMGSLAPDPLSPADQPRAEVTEIEIYVDGGKRVFGARRVAPLRILTELLHGRGVSRVLCYDQTLGSASTN